MTGKRLSSSRIIKSLALIATIGASVTVAAKEGMWLPPTLKTQEREMRAMGLQIAIDKIYNETGTGLNNAIVLFGRGCTGEVISNKGLILTNHHCGYGSAQALSSPEKDYFANGYWAKNHEEELPCKGLTVTFIRKIINVTDQILAGVADTMNDTKRDSIVKVRIEAAEKALSTTHNMDATIKAYFKGNEFWAAISETFKDIRFVGFPPNGIGAFGGDEENWMWPRHTGDFSIFRVYAGPDNKPAEYAANNKPYQTEQYFELNTGGYKEGDFTMVYGFPGTTNEYISSFALKHVYSISDPIAIEARTLRLNEWTKHMDADRDIFIKYTSKRAGVANGWKKWQGEVLGLKLNNATKKKEQYEKSFAKWAKKDNSIPWADNLIPDMKKAAESADDLVYQERYINEAALGVELVQQGALADKLMNYLRKYPSDQAKDSVKKLVQAQEGFYKNYDAATDKDVFKVLIKLYLEKCAASAPEYYRLKASGYGNVGAWAEAVYGTSIFAGMDKLQKWAELADSNMLLSDPAYMMNDAVMTNRKKTIAPALTKYNASMRYLERLYMKAQMAHQSERIFYPDANLTLRLTYGKIDGLDPDGPAGYSYQTTLDDVVAHDNPNVEVFKVPAKLKELHKTKDYGRWAVNGTVPVAFVASNHTSGGNSGSPVLNAKGQLIGTNFDRAYEGTMSDYYFDPKRCRNISVDIRYTLFVIEKFGGAGWLLNEMKITNQ